jgi:uncharacterized membrane protein
MRHLWKRSEKPRSAFGDLVILAFLISQAVDGVLTYLGVSQYGRMIEANPLIASLMSAVGEAPALASAKLMAASLGMMLHLGRVHRMVAVLTAVYLMGAIVPWTTLLFFT